MIHFILILPKKQPVSKVSLMFIYLSAEDQHSHSQGEAFSEILYRQALADHIMYPFDAVSYGILMAE